MPQPSLPPVDEMFKAFASRDAGYDGIFITAVRTTGIFCRPSCAARKPARENVEFFATGKQAMAHGYRPCKRCRPMEPPGATPEEIRLLMQELDEDPSVRLKDRDLRERGLDPATVRRWFKKHHQMTFHGYQRGRRMSRALRQLADGDGVAGAAFDNGYDSVSGFQEAIRHITGRSAAQSRDVPVVHLARILTPVGPMLAGSTDDAICLLEFTDRRMLPTQLERLEKRLGCAFVPGWTEVSRRLEEELGDYFDGALQEFTVPIAMHGTSFQERVWSALCDIPHGHVRSYADQARSIGSPDAVRAVARANGDNRIAILIPCHRVIGSDGSLTGYGGGLWRKKFLLSLERSGITGDMFTQPS